MTNTVSIDLDGTMVDTHGVVTKVMRSYLDNPKFIPTYYDPMDQDGISQQDRKFMKSLYMNANVVAKADPIIGPSAVNFFKNSYTSYIITSRPADNYELTVYQCVKLFGMIPIVAMNVPKIEYYRILNVNVVIEDCAEQVNDVLENLTLLKKCFLFNRTYNSRFNFSHNYRVQRVDTWDEIIEGMIKMDGL